MGTPPGVAAGAWARRQYSGAAPWTPMSEQAILLASPDAREAASSLFVGVFNGAIALGALVAGLAADGIGTTAVMWVGGALAVGALVTSAAGRAPAPDVAA
ncbi:hypothetical protein [Streptomyces cyaneofuscatus]|uniref:hypothetical protein n=1 Tax=Streptomyces cyaneofuscatus TaxID=66883 RepID=UPI003F4D4C82